MELEAVDGLDAAHLQVAEPIERIAAALLQHLLLQRLADVQVVPVVAERPHDGVDLIDQFVQRLAAARHELPDGEPHPDAVPLGDVALDRDATALLAAEQHVLLDHDPADPLEADLDHLVLEPVVLAQLLHLGRGAEGHHHLAGVLLVLHQVMDQQQDDVVGVDELAAAVVQPDAVGVAVRGQAALDALLRDQRAELLQVPVDGLGRLAHERRVVLTMHQTCVGQDPRQHPLPGSVHGVVPQLQAARLDRVQVEVGLHMVHEHRLQVHFLEEALAGRGLQVDPSEVKAMGFGDHVLDLLHMFGDQRSAIVTLELVAVVGGRVVAGRDDDAHAGVQLMGAQGDHGRAHEVARDVHTDAGVHEHLGGGLGEELPCKTAVMTHHDGGVLREACLHPFGDRHAHARHVVLRELPGDDRPPSVRSELDLRHPASC